MGLGLGLLQIKIWNVSLMHGRAHQLTYWYMVVSATASEHETFLVGLEEDSVHSKFQALVYNILPSTTAVFSYTIGSRKLSANEQFFVVAQTVVSLLQTTQIKQGMSFTAANKVYTSTNKTKIYMELFFFTQGGCVSCLRGCLGIKLLLQSY